MNMLAEADGLRKLWCVRCKWKSTPCVLHFNLTSFHSGPDSLSHARVYDIRCCLTVCVIFSPCIWVDFSSATTINHIPAIFAPEPKWNKGKTNDKTHTHISHRTQEGYDFFLFLFLFTLVLFIDVHVGGNVLSWYEGKVSSKKNQQEQQQRRQHSI